MDIALFERLNSEGLVQAEEFAVIKAGETNKPVSVHWELRTIVYFGILMLTAGTGIILYKNIDTIGHAAMVTIAGLLSAGCYLYCFRKASPYDHKAVKSPGLLFDYMALAANLLMLAFVGYLQFQYHVFGDMWGLATFIPMLFLFYCAYLFDHKGLLSLAITNLGAWMGVAVAPMQLVRTLDVHVTNIIFSGIALGALLQLLGWLSARFSVKAHFSPVYRNFGVHVLYISLLAATFSYDRGYFLWFLVLAVLAVYQAVRAVSTVSFYYLVVSVLYAYIGLSYVVVRSFSGHFSEAAAYIVIFYFIGSGLGTGAMLIHFSKLLKEK